MERSLIPSVESGHLIGEARLQYFTSTVILHPPGNPVGWIFMTIFIYRLGNGSYGRGKDLHEVQS